MDCIDLHQFEHVKSLKQFILTYWNELFQGSIKQLRTSMSGEQIYEKYIPEE